MTPIMSEKIIIFLSHFQSTRNKIMTKDGKMERSDSFVISSQIIYLYKILNFFFKIY